MSLYESIADPAAAHRGLRARSAWPAPSPPASSARAPIFVLQGGGEEGRGEDVTYEPEAHDAQQQAGPVLELAGEWTFDSFSEHLGDARPLPRLHARSRTSTAATGAGASSRRRWTSRCARPAPRCTSCSAARRSRSRSSSPRGWATRRRSTPVTRRLARYPNAPLQARRDAGLDRGADRRAAGRPARSTRSTSRAPTRARSSTSPTDPDFYRRIAEAFPDAWLEDPDLETDEARNALAAYQDRITWDAPIHCRRGHPRRAGDAAHGQPQAVALRLA